MKTPAIKVRRKPKQSRARFTQDALLDSFVRLLQHKEAADITIREITDLAGVGLGTFYEYFSQKDDLLALTIHHYVQQNAYFLQDTAKDALQQTPSFQTYVLALVRAQITAIAAQSDLWHKLFLLERQISNAEIFQKHYLQHVAAWRTTLEKHPQAPTVQLDQWALNFHRISYGFISQSLMVYGSAMNWTQLEQDIQSAMTGYLSAMTP